MKKQNYFKKNTKLARHNQRRKEAKERQRLYSNFSLAEKVGRAKKRRGNSKREIARLEEKMKQRVEKSA